ncbi:hypothetical protein MOVS_10550 [Moraxella ovis]|uniref:D-malate degradation protein R n=1 Tax=Moraxella ovis TaxID=29433 RepID=A0A378PNE0_9GAMM|nr:LysR family transcriptional regulator [Moraxella ovis]ANB92334.1 hypothetical protein MOVS_10550 [Moraxella ovis]STY88171.1 D-malate degradation protein R [Moraxella ovis]
MQHLNDMAIFVEIVRSKSLSKAGVHLSMPKSILSERIKRLEKSLGVQLLNRTTRKIELTEAGDLYFDKAQKIIDDALATHELISDFGQGVHGEVGISLPVDFAYELIAPIVPKFCERYPDIRLSFDLNSRKVDLVSEPYDVVIRLWTADSDSLVNHLSFDLDGRLYASPDYLNAHGNPQNPDELYQHKLIFIKAGYNRQWRLFDKQGAETIIHAEGSLFSNSLGFTLRLGLQGLGVVALPHMVVDSAVKAGALVRVLPDWELMPIWVYVLTTTRLLPTKVQAWIGFLKNELIDAKK